MFNLLKPKPGAGYAFDFEAAKRRCRSILIDDDMSTVAVDTAKAEGYNLIKVIKVDPSVITACETGTFDIVLLDQPSLGLFDRIRTANPAQYLIAVGAQPEHPAAAPYFQKANGKLKKPFDAAALKGALDAGIKALFDRNLLLTQIADMLTKMKIDKVLVDAVIDSLKKNIPPTVGGITKLVKTAIKPLPLTPELTCTLWQLVKVRE